MESSHDETTFRGSNNPHRIQEVSVDLARVSKKRKACRQDGSRDRPIIIDDFDSPEREPGKRRQLGHQRRSQHTEGPIRIPTPADPFIRVKGLLRSSRKVVVISGAGISANAGFPTFQQMRKSKQTSFDRSLYSSSHGATRFNSMVCSMFAHTKSDSCQPTPFHQTMAALAHEHRLLLHITQNVDCVEQRLPDLDAKTIRLHGRVDQMRCKNCNWVGAFQPCLFQDADLPNCPRCVGRSQARASQGKRRLNPGGLRPDVLLYGEPHPDDTDILQTIQSDLKIGPDLVLVVGTTLKVPGSLLIATNFCRATRSRGGVAVWISKEQPPANVRDLFDYVFQGDCDAIALPNASAQLVEIPRRITMPKLAPTMLHISIQQFSAYDDILTATLVDGICYGGVIRKFSSAYTSTHGDQESITSILRNLVIQGKDLLGAERQLLKLPSLKRFFHGLSLPSEQNAFRQQMSRYLRLYMPDCAFEISATNRYTITTQDAAVIARKRIERGKDIKYLCGIRVILTTDEADDLDRTGQNFSIVETTRNKATSIIYGPARFANHGCMANAKLVTTGSSGMKVIATRNIEIGEEITVTYAKNYFGEDNRGCLCKTCEDLCRNGWSPENQSGSRVRSPGDYVSSDSHAILAAWAHSNKCLEAASGLAKPMCNPCRFCARHRELYGYMWPKTKKWSRRDNEERVYST